MNENESKRGSFKDDFDGIFSFQSAGTVRLSENVEDFSLLSTITLLAPNILLYVV
jgi:hypothetical protein